MVRAWCGRGLRTAEEVEHSAEEGPSWSHDLRGVVQEAKHGLQLPTCAMPFPLPHSEEVIEALELVIWETECPGDGVYTDPQDGDIRRRPFHLVRCDGYP